MSKEVAPLADPLEGNTGAAGEPARYRSQRTTICGLSPVLDGGFSCSAHHLNIRAACEAARLVRVVDTGRRFELCEREQERVWELWGEGWAVREVGRRLGVRHEYVWRCLFATGGVRPVARRRSGRCLSESEREEISRGVARGGWLSRDRRGVGRSTPRSRDEVQRNGGRGGYRAHDADGAAWARGRRPRRGPDAPEARGRWATW